MTDEGIVLPDPIDLPWTHSMLDIKSSAPPQSDLQRLRFCTDNGPALLSVEYYHRIIKPLLLTLALKGLGCACLYIDRQTYERSRNLVPPWVHYLSRHMVNLGLVVTTTLYGAKHCQLTVSWPKSGLASSVQVFKRPSSGLEAVASAAEKAPRLEESTSYIFPAFTVAPTTSK